MTNSDRVKCNKVSSFKAFTACQSGREKALYGSLALLLVYSGVMLDRSCQAHAYTFTMTSRFTAWIQTFCMVWKLDKLDRGRFGSNLIRVLMGFLRNVYRRVSVPWPYNAAYLCAKYIITNRQICRCRTVVWVWLVESNIVAGFVVILHGWEVGALKGTRRYKVTR